MGTYRPLYSLRVEHDYYDNLACRALAFRLKAGGVDLCRRRGLLFRQTAVNEWTLLYDCDSAGVDTSSDKVEAELCITDPAFVLFTDWAALRPENAYTLELPASRDTVEATEAIRESADRRRIGSGFCSVSILMTEKILAAAQISVSGGNAIDIQGNASPTIHVKGNDNEVSSSDGAGIYVAGSSTVTITGRDRNDVLTAQAGGDAAGIGGCNNNQDCGSINISNVTVIARGSQMSSISPGIGSTSTNQCGQITIDNATVHAYGKGASNTAECPAIGTGIATSLAYGTTLPTVIIRNGAEVHAHRGGGSADYIGYPFVLGSSTGAASAINPGAGGSITGSTVYCYTGDTLDKTVE